MVLLHIVALMQENPVVETAKSEAVSDEVKVINYRVLMLIMKTIMQELNLILFYFLLSMRFSYWLIAGKASHLKCTCLISIKYLSQTILTKLNMTYSVLFDLSYFLNYYFSYLQI